MSYEYNEDNLVEQSAIDIFKKIGWQTQKAYRDERFGLKGTLGRENKSEIILSKYLLPILEKLNPGMPKQAYQEAFLKITEAQADKKFDRIKTHYGSGYSWQPRGII